MLQSICTQEGRGWETSFSTPSREQGWLSGERDEPGNSILTSITNLLSCRRQGTVSQPELAFCNKEVIILSYLRELHSSNFPKQWSHNLQHWSSSLQGLSRESITKWAQPCSSQHINSENKGSWATEQSRPTLSWAEFRELIQVDLSIN